MTESAEVQASLMTSAQRAAVQAYLQEREEKGHEACDQSITILHSRVVQKSYGTEKRFFCPPPAIKLEGDKWVSPPDGKICIYVSMGSLHSKGQYQPVTLTESLYGSSRSLYISDADKRRSFCLHFKTFFSNGRDVGTFTSKPIKVISKPSKKKQSTKNNPEMCIEHGREIALFNRARSQSGNIRYLAGDTADGFRTETSFWTTFTIKLIEEEGDVKPSTTNPLKPRFIMYGNSVTLQCSTTKQRLGPFVLLKTDRNKVIPSANDPVSQLQKVALQSQDGMRGFVTITDQEKVAILQPKTACLTSPQLPDTALWTITSCDRVSLVFHEPAAILQHQAPVNPVPVVTTVKTLGDTIEIYGENFSTLLVVWFGNVPAETWYRCEELLMCKRPEFRLVCPQSQDGICRSTYVGCL
eukprot:gene4676-8621_t